VNKPLAVLDIVEIHAHRESQFAWRCAAKLDNGLEIEISREAYDLLERSARDGVPWRVRLDLEGAPVERATDRGG
jgi:hypothetical protein